MIIEIFNYFIGSVSYLLIDSFITNFMFNTTNQLNLCYDPILNVNDNLLTLIFNYKLNLYLIITPLLIYYFKKYSNIQNIYIGIIFINYSLMFYSKNLITLNEFTIRRNLMWCFTTPAMLHLYTKVNKIKFIDIKPVYHIIPIIINLFEIFFAQYFWYKIVEVILIMMEVYFTYNLAKQSQYLYNKVFVGIWVLFGYIAIITKIGLISIIDSNIYFGISDIIAKFLSILIIYDNEQQKISLASNLDLESYQLITKLISILHIQKQKNTSNKTNELISYFENKINIIDRSESKDLIKLDLLKKILPYDFDDKYLLPDISKYKKYENICIMFIDIINYSEIAKTNNDIQLYDFLHNLYSQYDNILRKYILLQKIETIGDSYMVVGDLNNNNDTEIIIKQIITFAEELINSNNIKVPIRVGIHIGSVTVGILGTDIPRFCVIGQNVNIASRLETTSEENKINISKELYDKITNKQDYLFEQRDNIYFKNMGNFTTYFITTHNTQHTTHNTQHTTHNSDFFM